MIKMTEVSKVFSSKKASVTAVNNASFEVNSGEIFGLIGTNGAGKTTIMRMIATMLKPTSGQIEVMGKNVLDNAENARKNIGILFGGDAGLYDRLTAYENIEYFAKLNGMTSADSEKRIFELADFFGMRDYLYRHCGKFSKGMKQKVCFARAIVHNPQVMLFDEPTSGLDILAAEEVLSFMKLCQKQNKTVLLSSHDMAEVNELCNRVAIIDNGIIKDSGTIESLQNKYNKNSLKEVFFNITKEVNSNEI
jgi:sodium transport system ATP-binding protein